MSFDLEISNTSLELSLGLGLHGQYYSENFMKKKEYDPSKCNYKANPISLALEPIIDDEANFDDQQQQGSKIVEASSNSPSGVSNSLISNSSSIKKERDQFLREEFEVEVDEKVPSSRSSRDADEDGNPRKKLRLTTEQSAILEENFKQHSTLNPKQKQELATKLNLRARQVEVWFQNRRARTKLKQTEMDCELLRKCCKTLTEENKRLQKELQELRSMQTTIPPFYMQIPAAAATLTLCHSCERGICPGGNGNGNNNNNNNNSNNCFYKNNNYPFSHSSSSAACSS